MRTVDARCVALRSLVARVKLIIWIQARRIAWLFHRRRLARVRSVDPGRFPHLVARHSSVLIREPGRALAELQYNKVHNLRLTAPRLDGATLRPGEAFSFCYLAGPATRRGGYREGLELHGDRMVPGVGGGRCQFSNLLYWLALHLDMEIIEHHRHQYDLFPDHNRTLPFGCGATIFYNLKDLVFRNRSDRTFLFRFAVTDTELVGEAYADRPLDFHVQIVETDHQFRVENGVRYRSNRIWRRVLAADGATVLREDLLGENHCQVLY